MGEFYDIGLQVGLELAKEIDKFIETHEDFGKYGAKQKTLTDSKVYSWNMKWCPWQFKDEAELVDILKKYQDWTPGDCDDVSYAYKLVAQGEEGGYDNESNYVGEEEFDGLSRVTTVRYPCVFDEEENLLWDTLKSHMGHEVEIAAYGDIDDPVSICLEDLDTNEVILDAELYTLAAR